MMETEVILKPSDKPLAEIATGSIHVIVMSPPYNLSYRQQKGKKHNLDGYDGFSDCLPEDQYQAQQIAMLNECGRVLDQDGSVFYVHKDRRIDGRTVSPASWIELATGLAPYQTIVLNRDSSHNVDPIRLPPTTEYIYWFSRPDQRPRFNQHTRSWGLVWDICPHSETAGIPHPAPFPLVIPLRCILMTAPRAGEIVLDPYLGSGTTAVAATLLGLPWIGYEQSDRYIALARTRVAECIERWRNPDIGPASWEKTRTRRKAGSPDWQTRSRRDGQTDMHLPTPEGRVKPVS